MKLRLYNRSIYTLFILLLLSCKTTQKSVIAPPLEINYPTTTGIKQPTAVLFDIPSGELKESILTHSRASIPTDFSKMEREHVSGKNSSFFSDGDERIIDWNTERAYCFPLPGAKVISSYGGRRRHSGIDLKTHPSDTIRSVFDGVVRMAKRYAAYGNVVVVRHASGVETVYSHNIKNLVKAGTFVLAGEPIALVGRTGRATTEHLHFEIRINGKHLNPTVLFDFDTHLLKDTKFLCKKRGSDFRIETLP